MSSKDVGVGIPESYKTEARKGCDILFRVTIKGRKILTDGIPLHMSLKIFTSKSEFDIKEIEQFVKEKDICSPDPSKLTYEPIIFSSEKTATDYYMLKIHGLDPKYKALYDKYDKIGTVYKKFMTHVTIDKAIYDDIKENGIKPEEIQFSHLILEEGSGNTLHDFEKSEDLQKGLKHIGAAIGVAAGLAGSPTDSQTARTIAPNMHAQQSTQQANSQGSQYDSKRMLASIAQVESSKGKNVSYPAVGGIHHGESAVGKYGLMPNTIRETIHMNPDLKNKYGKGLNLKGDDMRRYMQDNPEMEDAVAQKHLQRLEHHFGQSQSKIGYAWLEGIRGTYKAQKANKDIENHWHVKRIKEAYSKEK
jgi:hypothetical protein